MKNPLQEMISLNDKLAKITSTQPSGWKEKATARKKNRAQLKRSISVAVKVLQALRRQGITKRDLAGRIGVEEGQVNRIVKGEDILTPEILVKLESALNIQVSCSSYRVAGDFATLPVTT